MKKLFTLIITCFLCFSCQKESVNIKLTPIKQYQISFPNEEKGKKEFKCMNLIDLKGKPYFQKLNLKNKTLDIKDIIHNTNIHIPLNVVFEKVQLDRTSIFLTQNLDSIFISSYDRKQRKNFLFLINQKGEVKENYSLKLPDKYSIISGYRLSDLTFHKDKIYFTVSYYEDPSIPMSEDLDFKNICSKKTELVFDTKLKKNLYLMGSYPNIYMEDFYYQKNTRKCFNNKNQLVTAFQCSHDLQIFKDSNLIQTIEVKSRFINDFIPFDLKKSMDFSFIKKYHIENPVYTEFYYDSYRDLCYRVAKHQANPLDDNGENLRKYEDINYSIMFIDKDFNLVDELMLDIKKYGHFLALPEGILILEKGDSTFWEHKTMKFTLFDLQIEKKK